MSIAVLRSDYVTNCTASTSVRFDRDEARNRNCIYCVKKQGKLHAVIEMMETI